MLNPDGVFRKTPYVLDDAQERFVVASWYAYEITGLRYLCLLELLIREKRAGCEEPGHLSFARADLFSRFHRLPNRNYTGLRVLSARPLLETRKPGISFLEPSAASIATQQLFLARHPGRTRRDIPETVHR